MKSLALALLLIGSNAWADTPASGYQQILGGTDQTPIGNVGDALKVSVSGGGGTSTVDQGSPSIAADAWPMYLCDAGGVHCLALNVDGSLNVLATLTGPVTVSNPSVNFALETGGNLAAILAKLNASIAVTVGSLPLPSGAATDTLQSSIISTLGSPFQAGGSIGNTAFGISGSLPAFAATPTFNLGTLNGAATAANQTTMITALGSPFQAGGSIGNSSFGISGTLPAFAATPVFNVGTTGGIALDSSVSELSAKFGSLGQKAMSGSAPVVLASDQSAVPVNATLQAGTNSIGTVVQTALVTGSLSNISSIGTTSASTFSAPANAVGFVLEAESGNTANVRWAVGVTATSSVGMLAEPGRDTGYIPLAANISIIAISGTQAASVQWVVR